MRAQLECELSHPQLEVAALGTGVLLSNHQSTMGPTHCTTNRLRTRLERALATVPQPTLSRLPRPPQLNRTRQ